MTNIGGEKLKAEEMEYLSVENSHANNHQISWSKTTSIPIGIANMRNKNNESYKKAFHHQHLHQISDQITVTNFFV
jgi:hypothetical protein